MGGKGRGIGAFTFNVEALGIGRGSMPEARVGPNALYPNIDFKPVPLKVGEDEDYMLALKQEMRGTMQRLPHNIKPQSNKAEVERYTERYLKQKLMEDDNWSPGTKKKSVKISPKDAAEMLTKLDKLDKTEEGNPEKSDDETEKKPGNEDEEIEEEAYEEEDVEENDYIDNYFDNGEEFGGGSDDNMDTEATY
ncbi:DNA-directed RNA polymerase III subunit RPC7 [Liparis tanakae]|uniref:DNA-directed RNA polymerase III subunit RPC7 n=1 Tax=Liparis tanakae TaxID=230148 RepID=A0A4Z2G9S2_9TELE|nr:DNA-directed RNA polymerase III subunit RPC7 [Liparis tanakae]